jgi:hypothetical protein
MIRSSLPWVEAGRQFGQYSQPLHEHEMAHAMSALGDHMRHLPTFTVLGVGRMGAGIVKAPLACFAQALVALAERMGVA